MLECDLENISGQDNQEKKSKTDVDNKDNEPNMELQSSAESKEKVDDQAQTSEETATAVITGIRHSTLKACACLYMCMHSCAHAFKSSF